MQQSIGLEEARKYIGCRTRKDFTSGWCYGEVESVDPNVVDATGEGRLPPFFKIA